jgi:anaerobic magnesium-protoporphyrin IX monomethyl ester cyclase
LAEVLFGQSYFLRFDPKLWQAMQPYPPLGTLYAASYVREQGYDVALFDAMLSETEEDWGIALDRENPEFAVIYEDNFNYLSKMCLSRMRDAAFSMIEMAKARNCKTIVCGSDATDHAVQYLTKGADFVLIGEGEITLGELLDALTGRSDIALNEIEGLAFKSSEYGTVYDSSDSAQLVHSTDGKELYIRLNPRRPDIRDLDKLPFPAWDLVDVEKYRQVWRQRHGYYSMNMVTTRGCPYHCNWCAKPIWVSAIILEALKML